jgi:lipopolysaccharide heptosyltransferase II
MPRNILIVRFSSIGDLLLTTPLLRAIRTRHPDSRITFVVRDDMAETLRRNPNISNLVAWRRGSSLTELARTLRQEEWSDRLDLHCSLRSYGLRRLVGGSWTGYPKHRIRRQLLIATHGKQGGILGHVAERYFAAARDLGVTPDGMPAEYFISEQADATASAFLVQHRLGQHRQLIALVPGAAHFTKRWPEEHWIALGRQLALTHDIVVLGGKTEQRMAERIAKAAGIAGASAAGLFSLDGSAALLKRSERLVAGDTGLLHLATAVGTPVVALYGPTVEAFGFFPYHARAVTLQHDLNCRPCSSQGGPTCPLGHHNCLVQMMPSEILEVASRESRVAKTISPHLDAISAGNPPDSRLPTPDQ